jgi:coproporphyrinogen III oxidase-like Fe-S oxidoreductase
VTAVTTALTPEVVEYLDLGALLESHPELQISQDTYNINVTSQLGEVVSADETLTRLRSHPGAGLPAHLYFHVPLCSYICHFCNYVKRLLPADPNKDSTLEHWVELLIEESNRYLRSAPWIPSANVESVFIGGGTASLLSTKQLGKLIQHIRDNYRLYHDCEISLEGNPDNFVDGAVQGALDIGINRFSVGVQSLQDQVNAFTGRQHDRTMSIRAIGSLKETGRPFNVDMMFGLPLQTVQAVKSDMEVLCGMHVPTITIYRLRNVDRQKMGIGNRALWNVPTIRSQMHRDGMFPSLETTYEMRQAAMEVLLAYGYVASPCGWWSLPGTYPEGNIPRVSKNKWERYDSMVAFGPGAYGWICGLSNTVVQTHNEADIASYISRMESGPAPPLSFGRIIVGEQAIATILGFAFKANQPIKFDRFLPQFGVSLNHDEPYRSVIGELIEKGLAEVTSGGTAFKPSLKGEALHEEIISVYFHQRIGTFSGQICLR